MMLPLLDLPTLFIVSAVAIGFSGCLLILARGGQGGAPLVFWGSGMLVAAAGVGLLALGFLFGPGAEAAGYMAVLFATALSWTGARVFSGRPPEPVLVVAGPLAWLAMEAVARASDTTLDLVLFLVGTLYTLAAAWELWRGRAEPLRSRRITIVLLLLHAGVYVVRAAALAFALNMQLPRITAFLMFEGLLHTIGLAFLLLALMKERAELQATVRLRELALRDGLTGLSNRRRFDEALDEEFRRANRTGRPLTLLMIDVDHFKRFNDTYGHQAGDDCLRAVASAISTAVHRPGDLAARYGGEEFAVLLPATNEAGAATVASAVHDQVARLGIGHEGSSHAAVTVSMGIATVGPAHGMASPHPLLQAADRALYDAKSSGRNTTRVAAQPHPDEQPPRPGRRQWKGHGQEL